MPDPAVRAMFDPLPGRTYLDAATYGLPPRPAVEAMERALRAWQTGSARWVDDWDRPVEAVRAEFASIIGATAADIALLPSASVAMGLVADALKAGDVVVVPEDEHVSDLFPLLVAERRGVEVRQVPFADVVGSIDDRTTLVASSLVQMQTGRIGDLDGICRRARAVGATGVHRRDARAPVRAGGAAHRRHRLPRLPRVQAHARCARDGVPLRALRSARRSDAELCELARRARPVDALLRRTADARRRRVAVQRVAGLAAVGRDGRVHPIDRARGAATGRSPSHSSWPLDWPRRWARSRPAHRWSACPSPIPSRFAPRWRRPGSAPPSAAMRSGSRSTSGTTRPMWTGRSRRSARLM